MFGLTKREQRWKAEQKAAETIAGVLVAAFNAKSHMGEEMNKSEQLIACLEGEIAKRDEELAACRVAVENCDLFLARIAELEDLVLSLQCKAIEIDDLRAELAAIKAQEPVAWISKDGTYAEASTKSTVYGSHTLPLYAAPVSEAKAQVVMPEPFQQNVPVVDVAGAAYEAGYNNALAEVARLNAAPAAPAADASALADAFLSWKLPNSVRPDGCAMDPTYPHRYGTNLMTWAQAKGMFEYVLSAQSAKGVV